MSPLTAPESAGITGLFLAGLLASLHCAGMCGPLACAACGLGRPGATVNAATTRRIAGYQLTRIFAYAVLGAVAGAVGSQPLAWLGLSGKPLVLWAAILLILGAVFTEAILPARRRKAQATGTSSCKKLKPALTRGSWAVGLATPLLPCGVLYSALAVAALSGGPLIGSALMLSFGLGTIPLLAVAQVQWARWSHLLGTRGSRIVRIGLAVFFAIALLWRGGILQSAPDDAAPTAAHCPMCAQTDTPTPVVDER